MKQLGTREKIIQQKRRGPRPASDAKKKHTREGNRTTLIPLVHSNEPGGGMMIFVCFPRADGVKLVVLTTSWPDPRVWVPERERLARAPGHLARTRGVQDARRN